MKKIFVMVAVAIMIAMSVQAQIPAEVKDILQKCAEKNHHSGGYELDIKLHVGAVIASMNGTMKMYKKGDKSFSITQMKALGHNIYTESGFDGTQSWKYSKAADDEGEGVFNDIIGLEPGEKAHQAAQDGSRWQHPFTDPRLSLQSLGAPPQKC